MSIPAKVIVSVTPGVLSAGGSASLLSGLILTTSTAVPVGKILSFPTQAAVAAFFGPASPQAAAATVYFLGFNNSTIKPGALLFWQYNQAPVSAYLRGGSVGAMTLTQLQALTGILTLTVNGVVATSSAINLTGATSFSNAATIIQAAFTAPTFAVTFDPIRFAFVFTTTLTGVTASITAATGTLSAGLLLTAATGTVVSPGAVASVPATAMSAITLANQNWAAFTTDFEPVTADKVAFSAWTNGTGGQFAYVGWDTDAQAIVQGSTTTWPAIIAAGNYSGSVPVYQMASVAYFVLGAIASIDFARKNGRITLAFKGQTGITPNVTDATTAATLIANGYNFYGDYATGNQDFQFFYPGQISGPFDWIDTYVNEIWLNSAFQLAGMTLLTNITSLPYDAVGDALLDAAMLDPITAGLNFGAFRAGVALSSAQAAEVNNAAGVTIDQTLSSRGWYLQILPATPQVRAARGTPPMTFWYMDGGAVQSLNLASIAVQ